MTKTANVNKLTSIFPLTTPTVVNIVYKPYLNPSFTTAATNITINTDGTLATTVSFPINTNTIYLVQAQDQQCNVIAQEYIQFPCANSCPPGYLLSADESYCYSTMSIPATPPSGGTPATAVAQSFGSYSVCGSYIFSLGFNVNGTGTATQIPISNPFWCNGGTCVNTGDTTDGPMNRSAIWISTVESNQTVGFSVCINIPESQTYYVGCGADNYSIINLDGVNILTQDPVALYAQFPSTGPGQAPFAIWFLYPVVIQAGSHNLEVIGYNTSGPAAMAAEVYQNTAAEIEAATSYADLNLIFSTKNMVGQPIQIGSGGFGYTCEPGYSLSTCSSSPVMCVKQITTTPTC